MKPTAKQIAARKRNWKLLQLKSAMLTLKQYFPNSTILPKYEEKAKRKINDEWKIHNIYQNL